MKKPEVVCIGSATVDHILVIDKRWKDISLGDKVLVRERHRFTGGGATNAAVALAKLGVKAEVIAKLGDDHDAELICRALKKYKIKRLVKNRSRLPTSSSFIVVPKKEKDRVIYVYKGASNDLRSGDFHLKELSRAGWVYLASLVGKSFPCGREISQYCRRKKIRVLFNASSYLAKLGKEKLKPFLEAATILVINQNEARLLLGVPDHQPDHEPKTLLKKLHQLGPAAVVITDGARTVNAWHGNKFYSVTPARTRVVDTTGAGDAFAATLLGMLLRRHGFDEALRRAVKNAQSVIRKHGAKSGLLSYRELV